MPDFYKPSAEIMYVPASSSSWAPASSRLPPTQRPGSTGALGIALPAMIARRRTDAVWPLRWLRNAALIFTLAILSYQLDRASVASYTAVI